MKKGFTLVELLAVIVILGLLSLIAVPAVTNSIRKYRKDLYDTQISNIQDSARIWASDNITELKEEVGQSTVVTLKTLKEAGLVDDDIKDPRNKKKFDDDNTYVTIEKTSKGYKYTVTASTVSD